MKPPQTYDIDEITITVCKAGKNGFGSRLEFYPNKETALNDDIAPVLAIEFESIQGIYRWLSLNGVMISKIIASGSDKN